MQDETGARDLVQEEMITKDETDTNDEEIICETHSDFSQNLIITEDELSDFSEDDIENSTDYFYRAEDNTNRTNCNLDPTMYFCRFSNSFNNCWMNAAMQSILNLSIARRFVAHYPEAVFGALSGTPLFASLFRTAMYHPGKYFSPEEIYKVQMELSKSIESVGLAQEDDLTNFLSALLVWLNPCGMNTSCMLYSAITCELCQEALLDIRELGPILYLPPPLPYDSITSLLNRWVSETYAECCDVCFSNLKRKDILNHTDVIALHLPRSYNQVDLKYPVTPSLTIDIPVKTGTQLYRLSSVICRQTLSPQIDHFYTYLMCGQLVFKADDDQVTISNTASAADICHNGFIYVYEKYTEGQEYFSVGFKVTIDNHEVYQDPLQYVMITEDELSVSSDNKIQNGSYYFCVVEDNTSQRNSNIDPTMYICKFSNSFNNSWMNATMQSILNLTVARQSVAKCPSKAFGALSATPICASLLLTAMHYPGKYFPPEEIYQVLMEISENMPILGLTQQNYIATFLGVILQWLNPCGINSACILNNIITCERCKLATSVLSEVGPIVYLSDAKPNETTASLLHRFVLKDCDEHQCNICLSNTKRNIFLSNTDVITLHLQRPTNQGGFRIPVIPSACIDISLQNGAQLFNLSSVICRQTLCSQTDHFYTYLKYKQLIFKAEDDQVTIAHKDSAEDLYKNGFMYIYEKER
ncbi:uncharacterized protein LOC129373483 [Poeciliopsis prolifica]|uniref:uncharacterized protein LOC129373483 n=1 Tax=Poeciliopsis prolifica TaxID=188132 RepID=UPI002413B83E|nr:uncharacterized protein LOC129373483 [Poeciliopsis prolifica]